MLCACAPAELSLGQNYVALRCHAALESVLRQREVFLVSLDRVLENRLLHVGAGDQKIIRREKRLRAQADILQSRRR